MVVSEIVQIKLFYFFSLNEQIWWLWTGYRKIGWK